jgi:glycosyltransferase involved in cell wall biosynthesis
LRQLELCPHLAPTVRQGCAHNDGFVVLIGAHARRLVRELGVDSSRVHVVGAGYRDEVFTAAERRPNPPPHLVYVGKYSAAKGLPQLLDAVPRLLPRWPRLVLHVAGSGAGAEADELSRRMQALPWVRRHGQLDQKRLAELLRKARVMVLPSFYEGLPLVLVEALACGCRVVASALPGVVEELAPVFGDALELVPLPRMVAVDTPARDELPAFVGHLAAALDRALQQPCLAQPPPAIAAFTWRSVFARVEALWRSLVTGSSSQAPDRA